MIKIIFDTSVLFKFPVLGPPADVIRLKSLAEQGHICLIISEIVRREWLSNRMRGDKAAIESIKKGIRDLVRSSSLNASDFATAVSQLADGNALDELKTHSDNWHSDQIAACGFEVANANDLNLDQVLNWYFLGEGPFSGEKQRADIPDALVLASAIGVREEGDILIFVCQDGRLAASATRQGFQVYGDLDALMQDERIRGLLDRANWDDWWRRHAAAIVAVLRESDADFSGSVNTEFWNYITGASIDDHNIPSDGNDAFVASASDIDEVEMKWDEAETNEAGLISIPIEFYSSLDLMFDVFRGDTFDVPDWVSVSPGDFERDHYFEAGGTCEAVFSGKLIFSFDENVINVLPAEYSDLASVTVEEINFQELDV